MHNELKPDSNIKDIPDVKPKEDGVLTNVFVDLLLDGKILEKGFYKIIAERDEQKKIHIKFYQYILNCLLHLILLLLMLQRLSPL